MAYKTHTNTLIQICIRKQKVHVGQSKHNIISSMNKYWCDRNVFTGNTNCFVACFTACQGPMLITRTPVT